MNVIAGAAEGERNEEDYTDTPGSIYLYRDCASRCLYKDNEERALDEFLETERY